MVRASTDESVPYAHVGLTPEHGTEYLHRQRADEFGRSQFLGDEKGDHRWVRLDAEDGVVTAAVSADGETYRPIAQRRFELNSEFLVGLAVCSFRPRRNCEAVFESVSARRLLTE